MLDFVPEAFISSAAELHLKLVAAGLFWSALGVYAFFRIVAIHARVPGIRETKEGLGRSRETLGRKGEPHLSVSEAGFVAVWFARLAAVLYIVTMGLLSRGGRSSRETLGIDGGGYYYVEDEHFIEKAARNLGKIALFIRAALARGTDMLSYRIHLANRFVSYKLRQVHWTYRHL